MNITIELCLLAVELDFINRLREGEVPRDEIPEELEYDVYLVLREHALTRNNYDFTFRVTTSREKSRWLKRESFEDVYVYWEELGWIERATFSPCWEKGRRYILPTRFRSYPPCVRRDMDQDEQSKRLYEVQQSLNKGWRICFSKGCCRESAWRLLEAGMISYDPPFNPSMVLKPDYR